MDRIHLTGSFAIAIPLNYIIHFGVKVIVMWFRKPHGSDPKLASCQNIKTGPPSLKKPAQNSRTETASF